MSWINSIFNATSQVNESDLKHVANLDHEDGSWSDQDWSKYNDVAGAIVEPFNFPGCESSEDEFYYEKSENEGSDFVKGVIGDVPNSEDWIKVINLLNVIGY